MKKKVLMLAGLLSCLMMVFSVQAADAVALAETEAAGSFYGNERHHHHHHHHHHTTVNVHPRIIKPLIGPPHEEPIPIIVAPTKKNRAIVFPS